MKLIAAVLLLAVTAQAIRVSEAPIPWSLIKERFGKNLDDSAPQPFFRGLMKNFYDFLPANFKRAHHVAPKNDPNGNKPFKWIPVYQASGIPDQPAGEWTGTCFANNTISAELAADGSGATVTITPSNPTSLLCSDWYLIGTITGIHIEMIEALNPTPIQIDWTFPAGVTANEMLDIKRNGFRVFMFLDDFLTTLDSLLNTVNMFLPAMEGAGVPTACAEANLAFLADSFITMENRTTQVVNVDQSLINSGDFFGVIRLDGLDPMLAWAMGGSHTGHTTLAMRKPNGDLFVCESTAKDSYWPTNGIQCTPFAQWVSQAQNADYNFVWLPLSAAARAAFNESAAWDFINQNIGLNYGYGNLLWGWVDSESDNYPPQLTWQAHMLLPAWLEKISQSIADLLWNQAWNFRVGTTGLSTADIYAKMYSMGLTWGEMVSLPEQDDWLYKQVNNNNETVYGRSMVCDVFVCSVWKAGGVFGDTDFQCTEATNWDVYSLNIFEPNQALPEQCTAADPDLPFCQLNGAYRLALPFWNTRQIYTNSFNNCPRGNPPDWNKPVGC